MRPGGFIDAVRLHGDQRIDTVRQSAQGQRLRSRPMLRAIRRIFVLLIVAAIAGGVLLAVTTRPKLDDTDRDVRTTWSALRAPLATRYDDLGQLNAAMAAAGRRVEVASEIDDALKSWNRNGSDVNTQISAANELEGLGTRIVAIAAASPRFSASKAVVDAVNHYQQSAPSRTLIDRFNTNVDRSNALRDGVLRRVVANVLQHQDHPHFAA